MPGTQLFTALTLGKETTAGTAVATTRELYPDGTGLLDIDRMLTFHESANRGTRSNITHATQQGIAIRIPYRTAADVGVAFDELPIYGSQIKGGQTGSGAGADKTWGFAPSQTSGNAQESYTIEVGDDVQYYEVEYCQASRWSLSASTDGLTQGEIDWFGRQATKVTATSVTGNNGVKIVGNLWTVKYASAQSGLAGASVTTNWMRSWSLDVTTGLVPRWYQDGNTYFGQSVEAAPLGGTFSITVESLAGSVTQLYDNLVSRAPTFWRLQNTGPTLGSGTYLATIDLCVLLESVEVIGSEDEGINLYTATGRLTYDSTWATSIDLDVVCSIAALP